MNACTVLRGFELRIKEIPLYESRLSTFPIAHVSKRAVQIQKHNKILLLHVPNNSLFDLPFQNSKSLEDKIGSVSLFVIVQMYVDFEAINASIHLISLEF